MKHIKSCLLLLTLLTSSLYTSAETISKDLKEFSRIIVSPHINLILREGNKEHVELIYHGVDATKINVEVHGKTLRIYLDDAKVTDKLERISRHEKASIYAGATITAYVTYKKLQHIQMRGSQELTCHSPIQAEKFKLKAYGENEINLANVETGYFKTHLYGENRLKVKGGKAEYQKYKLYGENKIDATRLKSYSASTILFGDSVIDLNSQDELRVTSFGEAKVYYSGNANVNKGLILGDTRIQRNSN